MISPTEMRALPPASIDLMLVHSVVQYLSPDELPALIGGFGQLLSPREDSPDR
ncbi:hypothetical protein [Niveispirillum sp. BGYR6]|uniref:hypothetical protein n=1 Tax=Niveispirillum sp. BGYR6 TaxID=2971249 RepID=UPI0022B96FD3|nr:hypothetical protein [Niveispirillum sp. BGYR6]MDG5494436.1 hypothetical protein [Niveispirillum sp. BGYR6]